MMLIGFNVRSIRAKLKTTEREAAVNAFNDKENPVQVLVTSLKVSSTSLSLQKDCADVIFVDVPSNAQAAQQAAGRVIRIGQLNGCTIYIITPDHSYDQTLQTCAARKILGVIASYTGMTVSEADIEKGKQSRSEDSDEDIKARLIDERCADDYRRMFGQRSIIPPTRYHISTNCDEDQRRKLCSLT